MTLYAAPAQPVRAGAFDCGVVYDEFDSLMNKNFLVKPDAYVKTLEGRISRAEALKQSGALLLGPGRKGMGVAIVKTNKNATGKFLFSWSGRGDLRGTPLMIVRDVTLYGRVQDGHGRRNFRELRVSASQSADPDSGRLIRRKRARLWAWQANGCTV